MKRNPGGSSTFVEGLIFSVIIAAVHLFIFSKTAQGQLTGDAIVYSVSAENFAASGKLLQPSDGAIFLGREHPKTQRPLEPLHMFAPGYPFFVGVIYSLFGADAGGRKAVAIIQILLIAFLLPLLVVQTLKLLKVTDPPIIRLCYLLIGLWVSGFSSAQLIYSEVLAALALLLVIYNFAKAGESKVITVRDHFLMVLSAGLLFFIRFEFVFPLVFSYAFYLTKVTSLRTHIAPIVLGGTIVITPAVRNYINLGEFIPLTSVSGRLFWLASVCSDASDFSVKYRAMFENIYDPVSPKNTDRGLMSEARKNIRENPGTYFGCIFKKARTLFVIGNQEPEWNKSLVAKVTKLFMRCFKVILILGFLLALPRFVKRFRLVGSLIVGVFIVKYLLMHLILWGNARYFVVFEPVTILMSLFLLAELRSKHVAHRRTETPKIA